MKHWNRWLLLGLVAMGAMAPVAKGQNRVSTRVGLSEEYAQFLVDGQLFSSAQNFVWTEGSSHVIQFPFNQTDQLTGAGIFQYMSEGQMRFQFGGWVETTTAPVQPDSSPVITVVASPQLTEIIGTVTKQVPLSLIFDDQNDSIFCEPAGSGGDPGRPGVVLIDNTCYSGDTTLWIKPDVAHTFQVIAYPGYASQQAYVGDYIQNLTGSFNLTFTYGSTFHPVFTRAKRVRFSTLPVGLQVLVDGAPVTPQGLAGARFDPGPVSSAECGQYQALPVTAPQGIQPLCVGDFDFVPGSVHTIGAITPQTELVTQIRWVFDHFSNGQGQNSVYNTPYNTDSRDDIVAVFTQGIQSVVQTNVTGLKVIVDGSQNSQLVYGDWWGAGQIHQIEAPATQRDANGRMWKFTGWSDGGDRVHSVSAPAGVDHVIIVANYVELGQINITSTVQGLTIKANGKDCATPCVFDDDSGATLTIEAPQSVALGEGSRYQFDSWLGNGSTTQLQLTFTQDAVSYKASYNAQYRLLADSDPDGGATFKYTPDSSDGFFAAGTKVQISVQTKTGYKFLAWSGDLTSTSKDETITMVGPSEVVAHLQKVPEIAPAGIRNAAGDGPDGAVAPGSIIAIYGANLTSALQIGPSNPLAQAIGDVYVTVGQSILPLMFVSPTQINAQLLSTLGEGDYTLTVHTTGQQDVTGKFTVKKNAPGVFYNVAKDGMPLVAALHPDGTPVTEDSPAQRGETITFYGTGLGSYAQPWIDGFILPSNLVFTLVDPVKVMAGIPAPPPVDGQDPPAPVPPTVRDPVFAGGAAGMVGTSMVQFKIDDDLPAGNVLELYLSVNGSVSNRVQLPVK